MFNDNTHIVAACFRQVIYVCLQVASAAIRLSSMSSQRSLCEEMNFGSVKVAQILGSRVRSYPLKFINSPYYLTCSSKFKYLYFYFCQVSRYKPLPTSAYLKASENFARSSTITIAPGHWIDPGLEYGAPGEREFNLEVTTCFCDLFRP